MLEAMLCPILPDEAYNILCGRGADCTRDTLGLGRCISTDPVEVEHNSCAVEQDAVFQSVLAFGLRVPCNERTIKLQHLAKAKLLGAPICST